MSTPPASDAPLTVRDRLLLEAEIEAERTVAVLRSLMAVGLAGLLLAAVVGTDLPSTIIRAQVAAAPRRWRCSRRREATERQRRAIVRVHRTNTLHGRR